MHDAIQQHMAVGANSGADKRRTPRHAVARSSAFESPPPKPQTSMIQRPSQQGPHKYRNRCPNIGVKQPVQRKFPFKNKIERFEIGEDLRKDENREAEPAPQQRFDHHSRSEVVRCEGHV